MRIPAKFAFSAKYSEYGICGAKGLLDQGFSEESDMTLTRTTEGRSPKGDEGKREGGPGEREQCPRWEGTEPAGYKCLGRFQGKNDTGLGVCDRKSGREVHITAGIVEGKTDLMQLTF